MMLNRFLTQRCEVGISHRRQYTLTSEQIQKQRSQYFYDGESPRKRDVKHELRSLGGKGGVAQGWST